MEEFSFLGKKCPLEPGSYVVAYGRDSGGEEQERSVDQQIKVYQAYCAHFGLILVVDVFTDRAKKGSTMVGREGLDALLKYLDENGSKRVQGVLFWKINRLGRSIKEDNFIISKLRYEDFELIFMLNDFSALGKARIVGESITIWKAEEDLAEISGDVKRGLSSIVTAKKSDGSYEGFAPGTPPVCFVRERVKIGVKRNGQERMVSRWVPDPDSWDRGKLAWEMKASGSSYHEIHERTRLYKNESCYSTFFSNEIYRGTFVYGKMRLENFVPAMCTEEQWNTVQSQRSPRAPKDGDWQRLHPRRTASPYLVSGILICAFCGRAMNGDKTTFGRNEVYRFYICPCKGNIEPCESKRIGAARVEETVIQTLITEVITPENIKSLYDRWYAQRGNNKEKVENQIAELRKEFTSVAQKIQNLTRAIENGQVIQSIIDRLSELERLKNKIQSDLDRNQSRLSSLGKEIPSDEQINNWVHQMKERLLNGSQEEKKSLLRSFIVQIEAWPDHGKVYYTFPFENRPSISRGNTRALESDPVGAQKNFQLPF